MQLVKNRDPQDTGRDEYAVLEHEFRTPLAVIRGYADLLAEELSDNKQHLVEPLRRQSERLGSVVSCFLEAQELSRGMLKPKPDTWNVRMGISSVAAPFSRLARQRGLRLMIRFNDPMDACTDRSCVERALGHVLDNAIKFTDLGDIKVSVSRLGETCQIVVEDNGDGFPTDRSGLCEPFTQGSTGDTRSHGGLGTGLYIARESMRLIGGRLILDDSEGGGARVTLQWPLRMSRTLRRAA